MCALTPIFEPPFCQVSISLSCNVRHLGKLNEEGGPYTGKESKRALVPEATVNFPSLVQ